MITKVMLETDLWEAKYIFKPFFFVYLKYGIEIVEKEVWIYNFDK